MVDAAHFIGLVAGKAIPSPVPYADVVTFTTHKVLRGPRGGMILCKEELAAKIDKAVFPFIQGGPLMHGRGRQGGGTSRRPAARRTSAYARQVVTNAQALAEALAAEGMRPVTGGTDTHLALLDLRGARRHRQGRRGALRRRAASRSTRTPSRTTRSRRRSRPASGSAARASPRRAWARGT